MPRYFFHRTDGGFTPDHDGTELADLDAARVEAVYFAAGSVKDHPSYVWTSYVWNGRDFRIEVADDAGQLLCTVVVLGLDALAVRGHEAELR